MANPTAAGLAARLTLTRGAALFLSFVLAATFGDVSRAAGRATGVPDARLADLPATTVPSTAQTLDRHLIMEKVEIEDASGHLRLFSVQGPRAAEAVRAATGLDAAALAPSSTRACSCPISPSSSEPITSTISFAAAICSIFCEGIVPMGVYFSLVCGAERCQIKPETERFHQLSSRRLFLMRLFLRYLLLLLIFATAPQIAEARDVIQKGDTVVVFGCGPVGQFAIASAKLLGAGRVFAVDALPDRLEAAKAQGAEVVDYNAEHAVGAGLLCGAAVATDDGSAGLHGSVIDALQRTPDHGALYGCGPPGMLRALCAFANERQAECQLSLEEVFGCSMGVCWGCVVPVRRGCPAATGYPRAQSDSRTYDLARVCIDGTVFRAADLAWPA